MQLRRHLQDVAAENMSEAERQALKPDRKTWGKQVE